MHFLLLILFVVMYSVAQNGLPKMGSHQEHELAIYNYTTHKVVKDVISYARIQANNTYYNDVLHQKMSKKLGSLAIYLTDEQYLQVKISKSFDIQHLRLSFDIQHLRLVVT
jgi:intracellular septation protein A